MQAGLLPGFYMCARRQRLEAAPDARRTFSFAKFRKIRYNV